jgi:hypothetical protein
MPKTAWTVSGGKALRFWKRAIGACLVAGTAAAAGTTGVGAGVPVIVPGSD